MTQRAVRAEFLLSDLLRCGRCRRARHGDCPRQRAIERDQDAFENGDLDGTWS